MTSDQRTLYFLYIQNIILEDRYRQLFIDTIRAIVGALEAKDDYTLGHSLRVSQYALMIGERLGLPKERIQNLELAALLHDIGKIQTPDRILTKIDSLNTAEFKVMKLHPLTGAEFLGRLDALQHIVPFVKHHHERFDGNGYPDGLGGDKIPLESRIILVADSFDAMTTNRSYRKALPKESACKELERCAESQFDPKIVKVFIDVLSKVEIGEQTAFESTWPKKMAA
ncbi:HD-GYP domain-containing protein [Bdellovibrionota bacterium]